MLRLKADASATASLSPVKREGETLGSDDAKRFSSVSLLSVCLSLEFLLTYVMLKELVFLQFPPILPDSLLKPATVFNGIKAEMLKDTKGKSKSKIVPGAEDTPMDGQVSTQKEGRIGKLKVLKSGRMVMSVGDLSFEV